MKNLELSMFIFFLVSINNGLTNSIEQRRNNSLIKNKLNTSNNQIKSKLNNIDDNKNSINTNDKRMLNSKKNNNFDYVNNHSQDNLKEEISDIELLKFDIKLSFSDNQIQIKEVLSLISWIIIALIYLSISQTISFFYNLLSKEKDISINNSYSAIFNSYTKIKLFNDVNLQNSFKQETLTHNSNSLLLMYNCLIEKNDIKTFVVKCIRKKRIAGIEILCYIMLILILCFNLLVYLKYVQASIIKNDNICFIDSLIKIVFCFLLFKIFSSAVYKYQLYYLINTHC